MSLNSSARTYLAAVVLVGVAFLIYWLKAWAGDNPWSPGLMVVMVGLSTVAMHFPLAISPRHKVDTSMAVYFASLLLFGAPMAMVLVAMSQLIGGVSVGMRPARVPGTPSGKLRRTTLRSILFNTGQLLIAVGLGGLVYYSFVPQLAPAPLANMENLWAIPLAAATVYVANSLSVAVMVGLQLNQSPIEVWLIGWRLDAVQFAGLFLIGVVTALISMQYFWVPLVMALPAGLIYLSLKRTVELMEQTIAAVEVMADVVDMRDHYTFEHSKKVAEYSAQLAKRMGLSGEEVSSIRLAARVHDLGKIGVPDQVLLKEGKLTPEEWELMKRHPELGHDILSRFPQYQRGKELVLSHHERFDGKGYPNARNGEGLPLGAQIIAVADSLEAMTADRPYRRAMSMDQAMAEFRKHKGAQWNPQVVEALEGLVSRQDLRVSPVVQVALST